MRRNRSAVAGVLIAAGLLATSAVRAAVIDMNFDTLQNDELVNSYYDGGTGSLGSGPGPNYGVTFSNALVLNDAANNENLLVSEPNTIAFLSGTGSIMDVPAGFTTGFSFDYSAVNNPGVVNVYSGLDGSGTLLASVNLALTPDGSGTPGCDGHDFCPVFPAGVSFAGTAMSVNFSGTANQIVYDDITLGSASVGGGSVPEPASLVIFGAGLAGLGAVRRLTAR